MDISPFCSLLLLGFLAFASCEICPTPEDIAPCKCVTAAKGKIYIECNGVSLKELDDAFDNLRGKTIERVYIRNVKGDRLSPILFWNSRVTEIYILNCDLRGLSDTDRRPAFLGLENSLEKLSVTNSIKGDNQLKTLYLSHLQKLDNLYLSGNNIPEVGNNWFARGPYSLTQVTFRECGLSKLGATAFAPLASLRVLRLWGNPLTSIARSMFAKTVSRLETLDLDENNLINLPNDIFSGMPSLRTVHLSKNSIKRIEEKTWSSVWEKLDELFLLDNPLECDSHMKWTFSIGRPKKIYGTCDSPETVKGQALLYFIEMNRKLLSLTGK